MTHRVVVIESASLLGRLFFVRLAIMGLVSPQPLHLVTIPGCRFFVKLSSGADIRKLAWPALWHLIAGSTDIVVDECGMLIAAADSKLVAELRAVQDEYHRYKSSKD